MISAHIFIAAGYYAAIAAFFLLIMPDIFSFALPLVCRFILMFYHIFFFFFLSCV